MTFYRLESKFGDEVGKTFPQSQEFDSLIPVDAPNHLWSVWGKFPDTVYIPDSVLHPKAKVTDWISSSPIMYPIVSDRLKRIIERHRTSGIQFLPTHLLASGKRLDYWLLNAYEFDYQYIDFSKSIINVVGVGGVKVSSLELVSAGGFEMAKEAIPQVSTRESIWIEKLVLIDDIEENVIFFDKVKGGNIYVSQKVKKEIEEAGCTGVALVNYWEQYP